MKEVFDVLGQVWNLPWYKAIIVAIGDDVIVFLKLWPLWLVMIVASIVLLFITTKGK